VADIEHQPAYAIDWIAPESDLSDLVNTFYVVKADAGVIQDVMPAYSAQISIFIRGFALMHFPDLEPSETATINIIAPLLEAVPFELSGPALQIGASLTPLGWVTMSGMPADQVNNRTVDPATCLSIEQLDYLSEHIDSCRNGSIDARDLCLELGRALRRSKREPNPKHLSLVKSINDWLAADLNPKLEDLYARVDLSQRQAQRLCKRYFGVPPMQLIARFRAIRAAMLFANDNLPAAMRDEVLGAYFDQAHMIRDVRRYTGKTPRGFSIKSLGQDTLEPKAHGETARAILSNPYAPQRQSGGPVENDSQ